MQWPLLLSGLAMGLAAMPHCAFMCAAPCSALTQGRGTEVALFSLGRLIGYSLVGALSAYSVATLGVWSQSVPALRPLWTLLHLAFLSLGLWWLITGRHPVWLRRDAAMPVQVPGHPRRLLRSGMGGLAWVAWPCAALQGAILLAALGNGPVVGALVMAAFALASMPGLLVAPWAMKRWRAGPGASADPSRLATLAFRLGGAGLVMSSGWALTRGIWHSLWLWCGGA